MSRVIDVLKDSDIPNPEYLIKSIAEQGYSLETSLADLIDNSIAAGADKLEILVDTAVEPFVLFLADNGSGMGQESLARNMKFPSASPDDVRGQHDLGRFGLGLKTASFSQTRLFTVVSRQKGTKKYYARTWDVAYLKKINTWKIIENTPAEVEKLLAEYQRLSSGFLNSFEDYAPNTIVVWQGLYKFETYLENNRQKALQNEITEITSEYLSLVFHRYMERTSAPVTIRINNNILTPFNPFPTDQADFRRLETNHRRFKEDSLRIEGYILPSRSLDETKNGASLWTQQGKSLMDMEGLYIYRADRIILFGGWNGIIKKAPRLQLARLKVDIGNGVDHYFHLNVAKSSIVIPYELRVAFLRYVSELKQEAEKEYYNRGVKKMAAVRPKSTDTLFIRRASSKGMLMEINEEFPVIMALKKQLTEEQYRLFGIIQRMFTTSINKVRQVQEDRTFLQATNEDMPEPELVRIIEALKSSGMTGEQVQHTLEVGMGLRITTAPQHILNIFLTGTNG